MIEKDRLRFAEIMAGLADNFGGQISKQGYQLRFDAMKDLSIEQVVASATWIMNHRVETYPAVPTVKELRDAISTMAGENVSTRSVAETEVDKVLYKLRCFGRNAPVDFEHPVTAHLMTVRWPYNSWASTVMEKDLVWFRKNFIEAFEAATEVRNADEVKQLAGTKAGNVVMLEDMARKIGRAV